MRNYENYFSEPLEEQDFKQEALDLLQRLNETEKSFAELAVILKNLNLPENRARLSEEINTHAEIQGRVKPDDLQNMRYLDLNRQEMKDKFGANFFPQTLMYHYLLRQDSRGGEFLEALGIDARSHGRFLNPADFPEGSLLSHTGLSFMEDYKDNKIDYHEDLHQAYALYSPFKVEPGYEEARFKGKVSDEQQKRIFESIVINELNALRTTVEAYGLSWRSSDDFENVDYFAQGKNPSVLKIVDRQLGRDAARFYVNQFDIYRACETMEFLSAHLPQNVITHILLCSRSLEELNSWREINPDDLKSALPEAVEG